MLLLLHSISSLSLVGLIWFVQLVHYPLFHCADHNRFQAFAKQHQRRTTWVVAPLMLTEAATATLLLIGSTGQTVRLLLPGWILLGVAWVSTLLIQVPLHRRLLRGYDKDVVSSLVRTNWIRTLSWSGRAVIALALLAVEPTP